MGRRIIKYICALTFLLFASLCINAQVLPRGVSFDKTIHNFGNILISDGPVKCVFTLSNGSSSPIEILSVNPTCSCTTVKWTKGQIAAGKTGTIEVTYTNNEGPVQFNKTVLVFLRDGKKAINLTVRGQAVEKILSFEETYPVRAGNVGVTAAGYKIGSLVQGEYKSTVIKVANLSSDKSISPKIECLSPYLSYKLEPQVISPRGTADLYVTVHSSPDKWGKNNYELKICDISSTGSCALLGFRATTTDNFSLLSAAQKEAAPKIKVGQTNFSCGRIKAGEIVDAEFSVTNEGRTPLIIHAACCDSKGVSISFSPEIKTSGSGYVKVHLDTKALADGPAKIEGSSAPGNDFPVIITLYTNSPSRPIVNLFMVGELEK